MICACVLLVAVCGWGTEYSNTGYIVLGGIVEAVSGQGVDLLLQSRISARAGLTSTSFTVARNSPRFAHPYETQVAWAPAYLHSVHRGGPPSHAAVPCRAMSCRAVPVVLS
jgi:CubicO group peptidase (beta-lactamase class C family)